MSGWSCFAEPKDVECFMKIYNGPLLTSNCLDTNRSIEFVVNATMIAPILVVGCFGNCTKVYNPNSYIFLLLRRKQKIRRGLWSCQLFDLWSIPVVVLGFIYLSFFYWISAYWGWAVGMEEGELRSPVLMLQDKC